MPKCVVFGILVVALPALAQAERPALRIDDFEDLDLEAATGVSWTAVGDWLVGGASHGTVSVVRLPAGDRSRGALRLEGHLRPGAKVKTPFAGAWTALREDGRPCDLTGYLGLRFRVRGSPGHYLAGVRRSEARSSGNFMAPVEAAATWTTVEVRFGDLTPQGAATNPTPAPAFQPTGVTWIGVTSADDSPRDFRLEIDDVELVPAADDAAAPPPAMRKLRLTDPRALDRLSFATIARDPRGDTVNPGLPDARELQLAVDASDGRVWFRFLLEERPPDAWLGMNVALDTDGDPEDGGAWWGQNQRFHYDVLVTAYLNKGAGYWQGTAGVSDAAQVAEGRFAGRSSDVRVAVDPARRTMAIGVPRSALGLPPGGRVRLIGTVGSSFTFNDDVPGDGALEVEIPEPRPVAR
jgi:complex I intermediate-associated protein 30 (CIA30)